MNKNYSECKAANARVEEGYSVTREYSSLLSKLDEQFGKTKGYVYTALPLTFFNISLSHMATENAFSSADYVHANTVIFGIYTLKLLGDLTDRQRIKRVFQDKYGL